MTHRAKRAAFEIGKVALLLGIFLWIQDQLTAVRMDLAGDRNAMVRNTRCYAETVSELERTRQAVEGAVRAARDEVTEARRALFDRIAGVGAEASQVEARLEAAEQRAGAIEEIRRAIHRDPACMKRAMVYPTVQLRGHGTVGSGVVIASRPRPGGAGYDTHVLTAYHVVLEVVGNDPSRRIVEEVRVMGEDDRLSDRILRARLLAFDRPRDLALLLLATDDRFPYVARLAPRRDAGALDLFLPAYAVGCPLGNMPIPTPGEISSKSKVVGGETFWMLNAPTFFGNSGGGIYRASDGRLIGISSMIYTYGKRNPAVVPHMGLFVPLATIYAWLDEAGQAELCRGAGGARSALVGGGTRCPPGGEDL